MSPTLLVHHAANTGNRHPPSSLAAIQACLEAGARIVEVDITPLADGEYVLLHDARLEHCTTGQGYTFQTPSADVSRLHYLQAGADSGEPVGLLSQAVELVARYPGLQELQLDLKPYAPLTDARLGALLRTVAPVKQRVRVSSGADWGLRRLRQLDPELPLGFDPMGYLDIPRGDEGTPEPPFRTGAYGYRDDHPLAWQRWGPVADYLAARAEALAVQAPGSSIVWYARAATLARMLDDGFDYIAYLHARGDQVDAWTLDATAGDIALARRLMQAGIDRLTAHDAPVLASALGAGVAL